MFHGPGWVVEFGWPSESRFLFLLCEFIAALGPSPGIVVNYFALFFYFLSVIFSDVLFTVSVFLCLFPVHPPDAAAFFCVVNPLYVSFSSVRTYSSSLQSTRSRLSPRRGT